MLLVIYAAVAAANAGAALAEIDVLGKMGSGAYKTEKEMIEAAIIADGVVGLVSIVYLAMTVWCSLIWARITYRAMRNLNQIHANGTTVSPGWAVGFYFIPLLCLWKPINAVRQIWRASSNPRAPDSIEVPAWIGLWWAVWLIGGFLSQISFQIFMVGGEDLGTMQFGYGLDVVTSILDVALVALAFPLWGGITKRQAALFSGEAVSLERPVEPALSPAFQ